MSLLRGTIARYARGGAPHAGIVLAVALVALLPRESAGDEHADHHPGAGAASAPAMGGASAPAMGGAAAPAMGGASAPAMGGAAAPAMGDAGGAPSMMAGMAGMMAGMMPPAPAGGCMGGNCGGSGAAKTPIYPSLMTLPALTPAKRGEIDGLATQQINEGMARLAKGSESLNRATQAGDNVAMQQSIGVMREGLDELGAGIAARRVLSDGAAPRNLALGWFKREMNLSSSVPHEEPRSVLGVTPFHLFTMVLLIAFALAMVAMYFFKMRRAAALFGRIEADKGKPPPGSSPPLAGEPGTPPAPRAKGSTPAAPPAGNRPAEASPPTPPAGKEPAPAAPPAGKTPSPGATQALFAPTSPSRPTPSEETSPASGPLPVAAAISASTPEGRA